METDYKRWEQTTQSVPLWNERNRLISALIREGASVLDVGAGNMTLRKLIPQSCRYQPIDCVKGADDTIIADFNKKIIPEFGEVFDYVVCSGVMEYVHSPDDFLKTVLAWGNVVILSYAITDLVNNVEFRRQQGWFNDLGFTDLMKMFSEQGILPRQVGMWGGQVIFELKSLS